MRVRRARPRLAPAASELSPGLTTSSASRGARAGPIVTARRRSRRIAVSSTSRKPYSTTTVASRSSRISSSSPMASPTAGSAGWGTAALGAGQTRSCPGLPEAQTDPTQRDLVAIAQARVGGQLQVPGAERPQPPIRRVALQDVAQLPRQALLHGREPPEVGRAQVQRVAIGDLRPVRPYLARVGQRPYHQLRQLDRLQLRP